MRRFLFIVFVSISGLVCGQSQSQTIYFQSGNVSLTPEGTLDEQVDRLPTENGISYGLVCFSQLPSEAEKKALASRGISLLDYMPKNTFFARIEGFVSGTFYPSIVGIFPVPVVGKLSEELSKKRYPAHALTSEGLTVNGLLFHGYSEDLFRLKVGELGGTWISSKPKYQVATFIIPLDRIDVLTEVIGLQYLEVIPEPGEPENDRARANHRVGSLTKNYTGISKDLNGTGMSVMLQDDGIIGPHIDFEGRITQFLNYDGANQHGDHTGGTVSGAGNLDPRYAGMAPGSHLYVYGAAPTYPGFDSIASHYSKYDIKITSTSYSNGCNDGYTTLARELDIQVEQMDALSHVFSAGNNGRSDCSYGAGAGWGNITGGHKVAKNVITVANLDFEDNLNGSSSRGPAEDGRIKPDISAVGTDVMSTTNDNDYVRKTGTSMSCPGVAGTLTLLYQAYKEKNAGAYPDQELMKGVICNSADDLGRPGVDFEYGFGRINARKAFDIISNRQYFSGSLSNGDSGIHQLSFPSNVLEVKVMLIWKDPKGAVNANTPLVNDLDLVLLDPNSMENLPLVLDHRPTVAQITANAQPGRDSINNLEQVVIQGPMPGNYTIKVKGSHIPVGSQEYYK